MGTFIHARACLFVVDAAGATAELVVAAVRQTLTSAFTALSDATALYPTQAAARSVRRGAAASAHPHSAPSYFFRMRAFNQAGPRLRSEIRRPQPQSPEAFEAMATRDTLVLDARSVEAYSRAHIRGSLHIPFRESFAVWVGWHVPPDATLLFVADAHSIDQVVDECLLVGYERFGGWLDGGIEAWISSGRPTASIDYVEGGEAKALVADGAEVFDVREPDETAQGHVPGARLIPLGTPPGIADGDGGRPAVVYCGHGEGAATAASLLERAGRGSLANVRGGFEAITGQPGPAGIARDSHRAGA